MKSVRLFTNGGTQAVRLPKECRLKGKEVYVHQVEGLVMLVPKDNPWASLLNSLGHFTEEFMADRKEPSAQKRK